MKEIIPKNSRYLPITQQRWCCVPACISMVMYKHNLKLLPQEYLGHHLGLIVPTEDQKFFWNSHRGKKPKSGYGTQIQEKKFNINTVFSKLHIPLTMTYHAAKTFTVDELRKCLEQAEKGNKDVLVCFDVGALENTKYHGGHVCVFDRIDTKSKRIRLIDPAGNQPKWRFVNVEDLHRGMRYHWNRHGGAWEFSLKK